MMKPLSENQETVDLVLLENSGGIEMDYSKIKHIFRLYKDIDGNVHLEKHPVIYINSEYCYIKLTRKNKLEEIKTSQICEKYDVNNPVLTGYYADIDMNVNFVDVVRDVKRKQLEFNLTHAKKGLENAKRDVGRYEKWVCEYGEQLKALAEESRK